MLYNCERVTFSESIVKWRFRVAWPVAHLGALGKFLPKRELNWHMEFPGQKGNLVCLFPIMPFVHLYLNVKLSFLWKQVKALFSIMHGSFCAFFLVWWEWQLWACIPTHAYYSWLLWLEYEMTPPRLVFWILGFVIAGGTTLRHDGNICQGNPVEEAGPRSVILVHFWCCSVSQLIITGSAWPCHGRMNALKSRDQPVASSTKLSCQGSGLNVKWYPQTLVFKLSPDCGGIVCGAGWSKEYLRHWLI